MTYDTIVVGGGIIGLSLGWRTAQLGLSVCVLDPADGPSAASWVGAGMLAPVTEANFGEERLLRLNIESATRWPAFAAELSELSGADLVGGPSSTLHVALDRDQAEALRRLYEYQLELGLKVRWLKSSELRDLEPALHPSARSAILAADDRCVDPRKVLPALRLALRREGATILTAGAEAIITGKAPGIRMAGGDRIHAASVVLAAGSWSAAIEGAPEALRGVIRPVKGQILRLHTHVPLIRHIIRTEDVYLVPRPDGEVVVGATVEEMGFDTTPTAGAVLELLRAAGEVVPGIGELELKEVSAGLRPGTPDNGPLLGTSSLPGLVLATGHFRNGILQTPVTADGIAQLLAKGEAPAEFTGFEPARFAC